MIRHGDHVSCPDHLLTAYLRGTLAPDDGGALREHVARCGGCAATIQTARTCGTAAEVRVGDDALVAGIADRVARATRNDRHAAVSMPRRIAGIRTRTVIIALGLCGGTTFAGILTARIVAHTPGVSRRQVSLSPSSSSSSLAAMSPRPPARVALLEASAAPSNAGEALAPQALPMVPSRFGRRAATVTSAADLLTAVGDARRRGERAGAISLCRRLQRLYPHSPEAITSFVSLGGLLAETDPAGAWQAFGHYLRAAPEGELAPEALRGRALAGARLGDGRGSAAAWRGLLHRFPTSVHAGEARAALEPDSPHVTSP